MLSDVRLVLRISRALEERGSHKRWKERGGHQGAEDLLPGRAGRNARTWRASESKRIVWELGEFGRNTILVNENGSQTFGPIIPYFRTAKNGWWRRPGLARGRGRRRHREARPPDQNVVCVTGDGAFQMYMRELPGRSA